MRLLIAPLAMAAAACFNLAPTTVQAGHDNPLYEAAEVYRDAAIHFEKTVDRSRYSTSQQRRIVDRLEDATSDLRSDARRPERRDDLYESWYEIQAIFAQVEPIVFHDPHCPSRAAWWPCWQEVVCAHNDFARLLTAYPCHDHHGHGRYQMPRYEAPTAPVRSYRYNSSTRYDSGRYESSRPEYPSASPSYRGFHYRTPNYQYPRSQQQPQVIQPAQPQNWRPYRGPSSIWQGHSGSSRLHSPSQQQLQEATQHVRRSSNYRKLDTAVNLGAVIARLID